MFPRAREIVDAQSIRHLRLKGRQLPDFRGELRRFAAHRRRHLVGGARRCADRAQQRLRPIALPRTHVQINRVLEEVGQRGLVARADDDEPIQVKCREDLGGDPSRRGGRLGPQEHDDATVGDRRLELLAQQPPRPVVTGSWLQVGELPP